VLRKFKEAALTAAALRLYKKTAAGETRKIVMKRLISLILCLIMALAAFTACADEEETEVLVSDLNTLVMMVVTEDKVNYTQEELEALGSNERMIAEKRIEQYNAVEEALKGVII
jgi:uncharacterized lipoprotein YehR (DUF1307 family)